MGGIFDLHGTANQKDRFSQILKLFRCYKIIGLSIIDHPPKSPLIQLRGSQKVSHGPPTVATLLVAPLKPIPKKSYDFSGALGQGVH